jgi:hypothetical protein
MEAETDNSKKLDNESLLSMDTLKEAFVDKGVDFVIDLLFSVIPGGNVISKLLQVLKDKLIK